MSKLEAEQSKFVGAIREPDCFEPDSADHRRRMAVYQSLFINNIDGFLQSSFPVLYSILTEDIWNSLVRSFFRDHSCRSPYFSEISKEFVEYIGGEPDILLQLPVFASELIHYEWIELDVSIRKTDVPVSLWQTNTLPASMIVSPLSSLVSYQYPVHQISKDFQPENSDTRFYYVVYRDEGDSVQFIQTNASTAFLLQKMESQFCPSSPEQILEWMLEALPGFPTKDLEQGLHITLLQLLEKGVLLAG
ncbi:DUF2063 domain-containing protein [Alteromonas aestuariivivens]|uniref:DUF2063 domain-containing protein n=1 Tax=Alteromonas aestuariivivens TaxID=1938339 RepID=A0A3D8M568_9ALTE|nr:putative DNA-binding domain-containing protein [Alteromonas aestuariivivens]RDV24685.1 DUF2063 domain-containing protein [Alteromonas aestuariivivens]